MIKKIIKKILELSSKKLPVQYKIGNVKFHNSHVDTLVPQFVEIGDNFVSAPGSIILAHDASLFVHNGTYRIEKTIIGDNVFVGANAVIMPGVTVGNGVIVGAGAVVTKNIEPYMVVAGVPAKVISTVQEYIEKSTKRNVLVKAPDSFNKIKENKRLDIEDILNFREKCSNHFS